MGLMLRCNWNGDVERWNIELVLSIDRLGFCSLFDIRFWVPESEPVAVAELEPEASFERVLR